MKFVVQRWRRQIWTLFDDPQSSTAAFVVALVILGLIFLSCITFCLQTLLVFQPPADQTVWCATAVAAWPQPPACARGAGTSTWWYAGGRRRRRVRCAPALRH